MKQQYRNQLMQRNQVRVCTAVLEALRIFWLAKDTLTKRITHTVIEDSLVVRLTPARDDWATIEVRQVWGPDVYLQQRDWGYLLEPDLAALATEMSNDFTTFLVGEGLP